MILDGLICSHYSFDHWQVATTKTTGMSAFRQALKPLHTLPISLTTLTACPCRHTHHTAARTHRGEEKFSPFPWARRIRSTLMPLLRRLKNKQSFYTLLPDRPRSLFNHLQMIFFLNLRKNKQSQMDFGIHFDEQFDNIFVKLK